MRQQRQQTSGVRTTSGGLWDLRGLRLKQTNGGCLILEKVYGSALKTKWLCPGSSAGLG
jgi:hypothetical protein